MATRLQLIRAAIEQYNKAHQEFEGIKELTGGRVTEVYRHADEKQRRLYFDIAEMLIDSSRLIDLLAVAEAAKRFADSYPALEWGSRGGDEMDKLYTSLMKLEGE